MNVIKFIIIPTFLLNSAYALDLKKINYYARMEKLQKTNYQLSRKVNNARIYCFTGKSFDLDAAPNIRKNPVPGGLAILNKFDFERGVSYRRGLDKRRKKEENHPGRMAMDLIGDMVKEEIIGAKLKTYEVIMKLACSTNYLFGSKYNMKSHITTTAEAKVARASGGNCWDYSHVTIRLAKDLGIPLERKYKGIHMFVAYRIPEY
ncbi:MAG: hypothetical protein E2O68_07825, partial [Deltaproteobacteria bacterium]